MTSCPHPSDDVVHTLREIFDDLLSGGVDMDRYIGGVLELTRGGGGGTGGGGRGEEGNVLRSS